MSLEKGREVDGVSLQRNLYCLPSGPLPPNPAELLGSSRMEKLLGDLRLSNKVDYVIGCRENAEVNSREVQRSIGNSRGAKGKRSHLGLVFLPWGVRFRWGRALG